MNSYGCAEWAQRAQLASHGVVMQLQAVAVVAFIHQSAKFTKARDCTRLLLDVK